MNRPIKFRAWNKNASTFEKEFILTQEGVVGFAFSSETVFFAKEDEMILQQSTGLLDKNGREIYEGDIISGECLNHGKVNCVIGFETFLGITYVNSAKGYCCICQLTTEIIGNVFENPEFAQ
jgi:uncharacterized phage protein (TIGR01671 family)